MKCPICNGKGYVYNALGSFNEDCGHCQGTGKVRVEGEPMTNEEWFASLPTEEKAKFIFWQHFDVYGKTLYELMVNASRGVSRDKQAEVMIGAVVEWLKEIHE